MSLQPLSREVVDRGMAGTGWLLEAGILRYSGPPGITIRPTGSGAPIIVGEPECGEPIFVLREWTEYRLVVDTPEKVTVWIAESEVPAFHAGAFALKYENAVGLSRIRIRVSPDQLLIDLPVEVTSRKLSLNPSSPLYYRQFLRHLVLVLFQRLESLPFAFESQAQLHTKLGETPASMLFRLHFLAHEASKIQRALMSIRHAPHRLLTVETDIAPIAYAKRVDHVGLAHAFAHSVEWVDLPSANAEVRRLPVQVLINRPQETFDTQENRFVRHFLSEAARVLRQGARFGSARLPPESQRSLKTLEADITTALLDPFAAEASTMRILPAQSQVLLRRPGYADLYRLYPAFILGRSPMAAALGEAIAQRDVASLYEAFCYFSVLATLESSLGSPMISIEEHLDSDLRWKSSAVFPSAGIEVFYNRTYSGNTVRSIGSFSVELRPDIALHREGRPIGVFDAKFRMDGGWADATADQQHRESSAERTDLHKMHTYRDALGLRFAVALYPGDKDQFFSPREGSISPPSMAQMVEDSDVEGVGALTLRPGKAANTSDDLL